MGPHSCQALASTTSRVLAFVSIATDQGWDRTSCSAVWALAAGAEVTPVRGSVPKPVSTVLRSAPEASETYSRCALCKDRGKAQDVVFQGLSTIVSLSTCSVRQVHAQAYARSLEGASCAPNPSLR